MRSTLSPSSADIEERVLQRRAGVRDRSIAEALGLSIVRRRFGKSD